MEAKFRKMAAVAGAAVLGLALVQPAAAQRSASMMNQSVGSFGASAAHTSCDALQGMSREDCLAGHSTPSVTDGGAFIHGRYSAQDGMGASAGPTASAGGSMPSDSITGNVLYGASRASSLCDPLQGQARADCFNYTSAGGALQQGLGD